MSCEPLLVPLDKIKTVDRVRWRDHLGKRTVSGKVVELWSVPDDELYNLTEDPLVAAFCERWNGEQENTSFFDDYQEHRLTRLDSLFESVKVSGRLSFQSELNPWWWFREYDGIRINFGPEGQMVHVDGGRHRLAAAVCLGLEFIPAMPGIVHVNSLELYRRYKVNKKSG